MRRLILFLSIPLLISSCNDSGIVIKGKLENPKGTFVYLHELTIDGKGSTDSILLSKSGSFKFKKKLSYAAFYTLWVGQNQKPITMLAKPGESIKIAGNADKLFQTYEVKGSEESKNVKLLTQRLNKTINSLDSLNNLYQQFLNNRNIENIRSVLTMNYQSFLDEQRKFSIDFIKKNPASLANLLALYQQINSETYVFDKEDDLKYFVAVDSALYRKYKEYPHVSALHSNIQQMKEQRQTLQLQHMLSIMGAKAPEIALPSVKGDTIRLSSFKGKVILVYFWASWNPESRKVNTTMIDLYNKFKAKGFEIFQVSIEKDKEAWMKAIKEDGLRWPQVCDGKYWQSPVVNLYNFDKLPTTFLVDKSGFIISRDLKGEDLNNKLANIIEEKSSTAGK